MYCRCDYSGYNGDRPYICIKGQRTDKKQRKPTVSQTDESGLPVDGGKENQQGSIRFEESEITIKVGETYIAKVINDSGNTDSYIWESSNVSVASVDNGEIRGQSEGSCNITVTINGTNLSASLRVNVETGNTTENGHEINVENGLTYIDGILIANKSYSMPADFDPGVNQEALDAFDEMAADAARGRLKYIYFLRLPFLLRSGKNIQQLC